MVDLRDLVALRDVVDLRDLVALRVVLVQGNVVAQEDVAVADVEAHFIYYYGSATDRLLMQRSPVGIRPISCTMILSRSCVVVILYNNRVGILKLFIWLEDKSQLQPLLHTKLRKLRWTGVFSPHV